MQRPPRFVVIDFISDNSLPLSLYGIHSLDGPSVLPEDFAHDILCLECLAPQIFAGLALVIHSSLSLNAFSSGRPSLVAT